MMHIFILLTFFGTILLGLTYRYVLGLTVETSLGLARPPNDGETKLTPSFSVTKTDLSTAGYEVRNDEDLIIKVADRARAERYAALMNRLIKICNIMAMMAVAAIALHHQRQYNEREQANYLANSYLANSHCADMAKLYEKGLAGPWNLVCHPDGTPLAPWEISLRRDLGGP